MTDSRLIAALLFLLTFPTLAEPPGVIAITGGTVHPASGPSIPNGTVVIRNGLIEAVGAGIPLPADASTVDARGMHVYPGLIDAHSTAGAPTLAKELLEPGADAVASRTLQLTDSDLNALRAAGVTTILTAPSAGIFNGQVSVVNLSTDATRRIVRTSVAQRISYNTRPTLTFPDSLMGVVAYIRQTFFDAQQQGASVAIYSRNPTGLERPVENAALEALGSAARRETPVVFVADTELLMRRSLVLARELNVKPIIAVARQAYKIGPALKGVPVLVSVRWPKAPSIDASEEPLRVIRDRQLAASTPAVLAKHDVQFALITGGAKATELLPGVRKAIESGLSQDDALRALTITPARIFGLDRQLGSLERGKIANVIITDRELFDEKARVSHVFVDGTEVRVTPVTSDKTSATSTSAIDGEWNLSVSTPNETIAIIATLKLEDGKVTGSFAGDRGTGDIANGSFDGESLEFTISARVEAETSDWVFRGRVREGSVDGTVGTTSGTFAFSGRRSE